MTAVLFRKTSEVNGEKRFADPGNINHTVRVLVRATPKTAGKVQLTNNKFDFIEADKPVVTNGTDNSTEALSIRITLSGSTQNKALVKARAIQAFANVTAMLDDGCLEGFTPDVAPVVSP